VNAPEPANASRKQRSDDEILAEFSGYQYDWKDFDRGHDVDKGLSESVVRLISRIKNEPDYMLQIRLRALKTFLSLPMPKWGVDLSDFDFDNYKYYVKPTEKTATNWDELPADIRQTYDRLGLPEAEKKMLVSGMAAQYESEVVYQKMQQKWSDQGVIFTDMDSAVKQYPKIIQQYFGTIVPVNDNKFAALNTACWSGGSFVYVPANVRVEIPLQAYFRINTPNLGQFERTLIICEPGSSIHYIEGCTAPIYSTDSLHSGVIEVLVQPDATMRYTTIQNWSTNVYNLVTQRAKVMAGGSMSWVDGNIGSKATMKYPACILAGERSRGEVLSIAFASENQVQDAGARVIHLAPNTSSQIISKSISRGGGRCSYRGLVRIDAPAKGSRSHVICDALLVDDFSRSDTYPRNDIDCDDVSMGHEATVSKIGQEQLFYLMSRGIEEKEAMAMIVRGFVEPVAKFLPMEYALELNRLIEIQMENSVG
jgi:Fe-S cluster assembly protein SufB